MIRGLLLALSAVLTARAASASRTETPGRLIDPISCAADPAESYALYLPRSLAPGSPSPILFVFDPREHGAAAAEVFREASEKFGLILVSSNNTRSDGPAEPNVKAIRALWVEAHSRFSIDERRIYFTGFSGTGRAACMMATLAPGTVAGVIGCGAGFHRDVTVKPPFLYFGTIGNRDFNYTEMLTLDDTLTKLSAPHRIRVFDGPHRWAPGELATEAVEWMVLSAMRDGCWPRDSALIADARERRIEEAEELERSGDLYSACRAYRNLNEDFSGWADLAGLAGTAEAICRAPAVARREKEIRRIVERELDAIDAANPVWRDLKTGPAPIPEAELVRRLKIDELRREAARHPGSDESLMAERLLSNLSAQLSFYMPEGFFGNHDYTRAILCLRAATHIEPDKWWRWYNLAGACARAGNVSASLENLQKSFDLGFRDASALASDPDFESLRSRQDFREFLSRVRQAPAA